MKYIIEPIHLGRYWFTITTDDGQIIHKADGGSAFIMVQLSELIFKHEHFQYQRDQRASSDQLAKETICRIQQELSPQKLIPQK